jgi:chitin deacetylase
MMPAQRSRSVVMKACVSAGVEERGRMPWVRKTSCAAGFRSASAEERLGVLTAHPDLAGKLAQAKRLTADSSREQASAGLDALTDAERDTFQRLNADYVAKHGFPFIIAVRDNTKDSILAAFTTRIAHSTATEFATACAQVERIAELRLKDILP